MGVRCAGFVFFTAVLAVSFGLMAHAETTGVLEPTTEAARALESRSPEGVDDLRLIQQQVQQVIAKATPAAAAVQIGRAAGSGVVVSADGLVLTAAHVVGGPGRRAMVTLTDGRRLPGHTLGADHELDAGMIRIDNPPRDLPYAPVAKESKLKPGEWVVTVGQPGGMTRGRTPPARLGRVLYYSDEVICTDCTLVGGDSGGPLFNMRGEVVGIHSSIGPAISHNFHVPLKAFQDDWQRLVDGKTWGRQEEEFDPDRPVIGVGGREQGGRCLITEIFSGLPADKAGLKPGDMIAKVDGEEIKTFDELAVRVARKKAGEKLRLSIERGTEKLEVEVAVVTAGSLRPPGDEE